MDEHNTIAALVRKAGGEVRLTRAELDEGGSISVQDDLETGELVFKTWQPQASQEEPNKVVVEAGELQMHMSDSAGALVDKAQQENPPEENSDQS